MPYIVVVAMDRLLPLVASPLRCEFLQNLDLVVGRFQVMLSWFLDLEGYVGIVLEVFAEPDRGEVSPA